LREWRFPPVLLAAVRGKIEVYRALDCGRQLLSTHDHERRTGRAVQTLVGGGRGAGDRPLIKVQFFRAKTTDRVDEEMNIVGAAYGRELRQAI
jgi:hypothetical protein